MVGEREMHGLSRVGMGIELEVRRVHIAASMWIQSVTVTCEHNRHQQHHVRVTRGFYTDPTRRIPNFYMYSLFSLHLNRIFGRTSPSELGDL